MRITEHLRIVDDVIKAMDKFSKNDFDIVFDFVNEDIGSLVIYDEVIMEDKDKITAEIISIFKKYGYSVKTFWIKEVGSSGLPYFMLDIEVVGYNGQS